MTEARAISKDGFLFLIEAQYLFNVQCSEVLPECSYGFDRDPFARYVLSTPVKLFYDKQFVQTLFVCINSRDDSLSSIMLASFNHLGALQFLIELTELVEEEVK